MNRKSAVDEWSGKDFPKVSDEDLLPRALMPGFVSGLMNGTSS